MKYVYVMSSSSGLVKIGVSSAVEQRKNQLENQSGFTIDRVAKFGPFNSATRLERIAHNEFKKHRVGGEWFTVRFSDAVKVVTTICVDFVDSGASSERKNTESLSAAEMHLMCMNDSNALYETVEALRASGMDDSADKLSYLISSASLITRDCLHDCQMALMEKKFNDLLAVHRAFRDEVQMYLPGL